MNPELLLGDEAVGLAALHAGIRGAFSYPGTPATEILEFIESRIRRDNGSDGSDHAVPVAAMRSVNEKVAYEQALGMSMAGCRALVSMKHVGLNVAADPFINSALTGTRGGLVVAVADDPGMHSSQNEQDSRIYGAFAKIPVLEPAHQQEAYDMTRYAFELSERVGLPVLVRLVTRVAHSRSGVCPGPREKARPIEGRPDWQLWTLLPVNARRRYRRLLDVQPTLQAESEQSLYNDLQLRGRKGIVACGIAANYVYEAVGPDSAHSILRIGAYPIPTDLMRRLVRHCDEILIVEEGYPFAEDRLTGILGIPNVTVRGKRDGSLREDGEMNVERVRSALRPRQIPSKKAVAGELRGAARRIGGSGHRSDDVPIRPPRLCDGCPHCDAFRALNEAVEGATQPMLLSDIGCYTLGAFPPYNAVHSCVDMGASISMAHGAAKAGAHPVVCTIGDSTFTHSGLTGLLGAARDDADMTVLILDNAVVAMTGGQSTFATGDQLERLVAACGVPEEHIVRMSPMPKHHDENVKRLRAEIAHRGLSVIIASRPCIHLKRRTAQAAVAPPEPVGAV